MVQEKVIHKSKVSIKTNWILDISAKYVNIPHSETSSNTYAPPLSSHRLPPLMPNYWVTELQRTRYWIYSTVLLWLACDEILEIYSYIYSRKISISFSEKTLCWLLKHDLYITNSLNHTLNTSEQDEKYIENLFLVFSKNQNIKDIIGCFILPIIFQRILFKMRNCFRGNFFLTVFIWNK